MFNIPAITFYIAPVEKKQFKKYAELKGVTSAKLTSMIIRAWVQARMIEEEEELQ